MKTNPVVVLTFALVAWIGPIDAAPSLAPASVFGDHMVLQRGSPLPMWGTAGAGERVEVRVAGKARSAVADDRGRWRVELGPLEAGGPHRMRIRGESGAGVVLEDVMVGEVWICSGQSNMAWPVRASRDGAREIAEASHPGIRLLTVPRRAAPEPREAFEGRWQACGPETVGSFSAVAYYFGREIHRRLRVPVGLVNASVGGTPAEAWTPVEALEAEAALAPLLARWREAARKYDPERPGKRGDPRLSPQHPSVLWNGMAAPLAPLRVRGAIWYQGESNAGRAEQYRTLFPLLIRSWREAWGAELPFHFVQLANFRPRAAEPSESAWAELRDAQLKTHLSVPGAGMAVAIDIGEADDIHPRNKQEVGRRLALWALHEQYGLDLVCSGPIPSSHARAGARLEIRFDHVGGGLATSDGKPPRGFTIAGPDRRFLRAEARIAGEAVHVTSDSVENPVAVRYGWADNPDVNLVNAEGLPASPFRTDDWPGVTSGKH